MIPRQSIGPLEVPAVIVTLGRLPRSRIGGQWTRTVQGWRKRLQADGVSEKETEAEIALAYAVVWKHCRWVRKRLPEPEVLEVQQRLGVA